MSFNFSSDESSLKVPKSRKVLNKSNINNENTPLEKVKTSPTKISQAEGEDLIASYMNHIITKMHVYSLKEKYATERVCGEGLLPDEVCVLSPIAYANRAAQILYNIGVECIKADDGLKMRYEQLIIPTDLEDKKNTKEFLQAVFVIQTGLDYIAKLEYDYQKIYIEDPKENGYNLNSKNSMSDPLYTQLKIDLGKIENETPIILPYIPDKALPSTCQLPSHQTLFYLVNLYICEHPETFKLKKSNLSMFQNALPKKDESLINLCKKYMEQIKNLERDYKLLFQDNEGVKSNISSVDLTPVNKGCSIF